MTKIQTVQTFNLDTSEPEGPRHCQTCGASLGHVSPVTIIDRLMDAAAYLEALALTPSLVRVDEHGIVEVTLDHSAFARVTSAEKKDRRLSVSVSERDGARVHEAQDGHFRLIVVEPVA